MRWDEARRLDLSQHAQAVKQTRVRRADAKSRREPRALPQPNSITWGLGRACLAALGKDPSCSLPRPWARSSARRARPARVLPCVIDDRSVLADLLCNIADA